MRTRRCTGASAAVATAISALATISAAIAIPPAEAAAVSSITAVAEAAARSAHAAAVVTEAAAVAASVTAIAEAAAARLLRRSGAVELQVGRHRLPAILCEIERDALSFRERLDACLSECGDVDENIRAAAVG
jgi:hypothetical protein